jgi:hypothetical protein
MTYPQWIGKKKTVPPTEAREIEAASSVEVSMRVTKLADIAPIVSINSLGTSNL